MHKAGLQVLKAISASIRIQIMNLLLEHGPLSYTEIMNYLKLDATRDAGRFAYHLKSLLKADLIEPDVETKKYRLTDLGRRIIGITEEIDDQTYKRRKMLVRTSRLSIEDFDRNKIAQSLVTEANVPTDLAQKIAREAEKRLQQFKTKYLTAPLIREIVNTILIEKHYEDYRHKLTRLGLPVHEVTRLINSARPNVEAIHKAAGNAVLEEYTLLNILPRNISDAHLSGNLHLHNLGTWIVKPNEITHSLPYFLKAHKPKTLEAAFNLTTNIVKNTAAEASGQQNLECFNTYLAPYTKGVPDERVKELTRLFIENLQQTDSAPTTISLELSTVKSATYADEAHRLVRLLLETMLEENHTHLLQNPRLIMKIRQEAFKNRESEDLMNEAHRLAAESVLVYFANLCAENQRNATYTSSGLRLADEWQQDWELDTQRTGNLDVITLNMPRITFDAKGDEASFFELLDNQLDVATQALEIKYESISKRARQDLLPYLTQRANGDQYFRLENATRTIAFVGLDEAVQVLGGEASAVSEDPGRVFTLTEKILEHINAYTKKHARKPQNRLTTAIIPDKTAARRLAKLDVEKYGWGTVKTRGTRESPHYSNFNAIPVSDKNRLSLEERTHQLTPGGHLTLVETEISQPSHEELLNKTKQLVTTNIGFFTFNLSFTRCTNCKTTTRGTSLKCPNCSSTSVFTLKHV
jgi:ribonucleoside-triphosphate reductase